MKKLIEIQAELKAPKNQFNKFGKYNYRSKEDILEAVKPLLAAKGLLMTLVDEVKEIAGLAFTETIVRVDDGKDFVETRAQAGIEKAGGMNLAQAFGSSSSYSGKYALGNMFLLDDTKDADATNDHKVHKEHKVTPLKHPIKGTAQKPDLKPNGKAWEKAVKYLVDGGLISAIEGKYALDKVSKEKLMDAALNA